MLKGDNGTSVNGKKPFVEGTSHKSSEVVPFSWSTGTKQKETTREACSRCGSTDVQMGPGKGPHYASLLCAGCGKFLQWLRRPATEDGPT